MNTPAAYRYEAFPTPTRRAARGLRLLFFFIMTWRRCRCPPYATMTRQRYYARCLRPLQQQRSMFATVHAAVVHGLPQYAKVAAAEVDTAIDRHEIPRLMRAAAGQRCTGAQRQSERQLQRWRYRRACAAR